ncbi:MAG: outer membrane beta-barrel protein [Melioribacteraceae bacterium]|nr:outer membrane beta-barrel protein [Melioribacteraceae bacterium]
MKLKIVLGFLLIPFILSAQWNSASVKLGHFNPGATDGGFIVGYEGGKFVDRNLSIGWSIDWFNKNYVDKSLVREFDYYFGPSGRINELRAETNLHSIPIMFTMSGYFPMTPRVSAYVTGGVGAEILLVFYNNFQNPQDDEFQGAFDFSWRAGIGMLYELGHRSDIFGEITYHASEPSWTYEVQDSDLEIKRTFERVFNMSGVMARVGLRFYW